MRVAVLDDYQRVALTCADWGPVTRVGEVDVFHDHEPDPERLVARLAPYDAVVLMRERTPVPGAVIDRLPALRLIVTTGVRTPRSTWTRPDDTASRCAAPRARPRRPPS